MTKEQYIESVFKVAKEHGHKIEINRDGLRQIDFVHKKLHEGHFEALYPAILETDAHNPTLIDKVAPGRSCAHRPMREIIQTIA